MNRLDREVARLVAALAGWRPLWTWQIIRFADASDVRYAGLTVRVPRRALRSPEEYAVRFEYHLRAGYSWVNLNAAGIVDEALIVLVEVPNYSSGAPADQVAVNLSGPMAGAGLELTDDCNTSPVADAILRACDEWKAGAIDPAALGGRLVELTSQLDVPAQVRQGAKGWCQQLVAAWEWAESGDIRGLGRAEGIVFALRAWADDLRQTAEQAAAPDRPRD